MTNKCINTFLTLLTVAAPFGAVADRFYVVPADLEPGKTETLRFVLENSQDYYGFQAEVKLPEGLTALENSEGDLDITLSSRADGGNYMLNSNTLGDGMLIMGAFSASHMSFTGDDGVLVNLNVSVADDFAGGTVELSDIMFIDSQDKDVEFDSTSAYFGVAATAISISMPTLTITEDETAALSVTFTPGSATDKTVTWTSSDESVATVSADGVVTGVKAGTATIMATSANGLTATCEVTVEAKIIAVESIAISSTELTLTEGDNATLTATIAPTDATDKNVTWASSDETVATVSAEGVVTAVKAGKATITVTSSNGKTATCEVTVDAKIIAVESIAISSTELTLTEGDNATLVATIAPTDATDKNVTWASSDEAVATVSAEGVVTAVKAGKATITVTSSNGKTATCEVTVDAKIIFVESLTIDPTTWSGVVGSEFKITATVLPADATDRTLTWTSSDESVATVDDEGNVKILKSSSCIITVSTTDGSGLSAECFISGVSGVETILGTDAEIDVYDINGALLKRGCTREELKQLTPAVYILRSGDTVVKTVIR